MSDLAGARDDEAVRIIESEEELRIYIGLDYYLGNYSPGLLSVIRPDGGGLVGYVTGELADEYGRLYDPWNYRVWKQRRYDEEYRSALANWSA